MNLKCLPHFRSKRLRWGPYSCFVEIIDFGIGRREHGQAGLTVLYSGVRANFRRPRPFNYSGAGARDTTAFFLGQIKPPHHSCLCPPPAMQRPDECFMALPLSSGLLLWLPAALAVARKELSRVKQKKQRNDREPKVFWMPWSQSSLGKIKDQSCILK